jgi:hypothetical protein
VEIDRSAQVVDAGRRELESVRKWVVDAIARVPEGQGGERMRMAIAQRGFVQLQKTVQRSNAQSNAIRETIRGLGDEYQALGNQRFGKTGGGSEDLLTVLVIDTKSAPVQSGSSATTPVP